MCVPRFCLSVLVQHVLVQRLCGMQALYAWQAVKEELNYAHGVVLCHRLCHDDACDHRLDRYAVSEMQCMLCGVRQPVAGESGLMAATAHACAYCMCATYCPLAEGQCLASIASAQCSTRRQTLFREC
jgi:hypothetical protein